MAIYLTHARRDYVVMTATVGGGVRNKDTAEDILILPLAGE